MTSPRLAICIPEQNRPGLLREAVASALNQTVPARIVISDDGADPDRTRAMLRTHYSGPLDSGQIVHFATKPRGAWQNWKAAMQAADTPFAAFLQNDDVVSRKYAERILYAFDEAERLGARPMVWMARMHCCEASARFGLWFAGNGPWCPMPSLYGHDEPIHFAHGACVAASSYVTSWSLSPAIAYRTGPELTAALEAMPDVCDIYVERIIPATLATQGGFIADPAVISYWRQHGDALDDGNLSRQQWADQPRQTKLLVPYLDDLLDKTPGWQEQFRAWCGIIPPTLIIPWLGQLDTTEREGGASRHGVTLRRLMLESLRGRVRGVPGPWGVRARAWLAALPSRLRGLGRVVKPRVTGDVA